MVTVKLRRNEDSDRLVARFLKTVRYSGYLEELEKRRFYKKPSEIRREKEKQARLRRNP